MSEFWTEKSLDEMSDEEWESLCDGCGRCCLLKLEDEETEELFFTSVSCALLDIEACRCKAYGERTLRIPECLDIRKMSTDEYQWLPETCAYRLIAAGQALPDWHPLVSGKAGSVKESGIAVTPFAVSEEHIHPQQWHEHIIELPKAKKKTK